MEKVISIRGAREHNLRNLSLDIPRDQLVVITGLSGSGKSSLAFDTIYAEGQRRYLESLSAYARQFLSQMRKPELDSIDGLSPSISIEQKNITRNPRSTVGTVTEIYDYLRLLYARIGIPHCPTCQVPIRSQSLSEIVDQIYRWPEGTRFSILAPVVSQKKVEYQKEFETFRNKGFTRAKIDGQLVDLSEDKPLRLKKNQKHDISIYIDRLILKPNQHSRIMESIAIADKMANGLIEIEASDKNLTQIFSTKFACPKCFKSFPEIEPRIFSFNSPFGWCKSCLGLGVQEKFDARLIIPDPSLSLEEGAILPWEEKTKSWLENVLKPLTQKYQFSLSDPFERLPPEVRDILLHGSKSEFEYELKAKSGSEKLRQQFPGVIPLLEEKRKEVDPEYWDDETDPYLTEYPCPICHGSRLNEQARSLYLSEKNIAEVCNFSLDKTRNFILQIQFSDAQIPIAEPIIKEISARLEFLSKVGLDYLSLSRSAATLSGGEFQRIRLATQIGSPLVGVLYILDEPSIGLHQRDNENLIGTLKKLRDQGNSVLVVEHDQSTIESADHVIDLGPGAGKQGGAIEFAGSPADLVKSKKSLTGLYLSGKKLIPVPKERRKIKPEKILTLVSATENNLKNIDAQFPLGTFIAISGVSGSGKSSLIIDTLLPAMQYHIYRSGSPPSNCKEVRGKDLLDKVIHVDQSPIGRTPRSNPATYTGIFGLIRNLFAGLPESKMRAYTPGRFSFNVAGGRCESCQGDGTLKVSMNFLPDVYVPCEVCQEKRYNRETLRIHYRGKTIADVLAMTAQEAYEFFDKVPQLKHRLKTILDVGLGYIHLGQNAVTFSGGEAQRIKLSKELGKRSTGKTLYILDEPTTGLHFEDIRKLMEILHLLVDEGNTVIVIEHCLDVIKQADHIIELGPEGGEAGGKIIFEGSPEGLANCKNSPTAKYLKPLLK